MAQSVQNLYKQFLQTAGEFQSYPFREYFIRRADETFKNSSQVDVAQAEKDLAVLKRQVFIQNLYFSDKTVVQGILEGKYKN